MMSFIHCEVYLYFCLWISANIYCLHKLYSAQTELLAEANFNVSYSQALKPGWTVLSRLQDISDSEWNTFNFFMHKSWQYLILQTIITELIRRKWYSLIRYWYIWCSVSFIVIFFGLKHFIILISQPLIYALAIFLGYKKAAIWIISVILLTSVNSLKHKNVFWDFYGETPDEEVYLLFYGLGWVEVRCISFSIDFIERTKKNEKKMSFLWEFVAMLSYVLYLPTLFMGPVILHEEFEKSFHLSYKESCCASKISTFVWNISIYLIYGCLMELAFHYIYFLGMQENIQAIRKLPSMALCGGGLWMGIQFHLKYVIIYGTSGSFARFDNIEPPPTPRCIARIHVYSQMWRYFDVGLYRFLIKYIYKPLLMSIRNIKYQGMLQKLFASAATFFFIFLWHGLTLSIFIWLILNFIGITLESIGAVIAKQNTYLSLKESFFKSDVAEKRLKALICTPLLAMSAVSNFYLFAGYEIGTLFFECFTQPSLINALIVTVSLYSCCQVSMSLQNIPSRTEKKMK